MSDFKFSDAEVAWELIQPYKKDVPSMNKSYSQFSDLLYDVLAAIDDDAEIKEFIRDEVPVSIFDCGEEGENILDIDSKAWLCSRAAIITNWEVDNGDVVIYYSFIMDKVGDKFVTEAKRRKGTKDVSLLDLSNTVYLLDMLYDQILMKIKNDT